MFIKAVYSGSAAGVLALGFHSVGMLAKLFSEAIENLDDGLTKQLLRLVVQKQILLCFLLCLI